MKLLALTASVVALSATGALPAMTTASFDTDGDRFVTYAEASAVLPTLTASDFRNLDINDDRRLSSNEVTGPDAQVVFLRHADRMNYLRSITGIDSDGDNFASFAELAAAYPGLRQTDFDDIDSNDDRRVSRNELNSDVTQTVLTRYQDGSSILVSLDNIDLDGSGFASINELMDKYPGLSVSDFHVIDRNRDNRVSFEELYQLETISVLGRNR